MTAKLAKAKQRTIMNTNRSSTAFFYLAMALCCTTSAVAQPPNPSFSCAKARTADEQAICGDDRLAELDQAVSIAYSQVSSDLRQQAKEEAKALLASRRQCGADRLCVLEQQINAIQTFAGFGAQVPIPPWVGQFRVQLVNERGGPSESGVPTHIGRCTITKVASITTRFGKAMTAPPLGNEFDEGAAVTFANRGYQVSYSYDRAIADSRIGDEVLMCLVSIPKNCPPGDERGRVYSGTNLRTKGSWQLPDASHMCGGA